MSFHREAPSSDSGEVGAPGATGPQAILHSLAELLASTFDHRVSPDDVHAALRAAPDGDDDKGGWRAALFDLDLARGASASSSGSCSAVTALGLPVVRSWECPSCGAAQEVADVKKMLRRREASRASLEWGAGLDCARCGYRA